MGIQMNQKDLIKWAIYDDFQFEKNFDFYGLYEKNSLL